MLNRFRGADIVVLIAVFGYIVLHPYSSKRLNKQAKIIPMEVGT
jgi:hypothetical protein